MELEMTYEAYIPMASKGLIGKTFGKIEKEFGIKIEHYHISPVDIENRREPREDIKFKPGISIKVTGPYQSIKKFREKYELF